MLRGSKPQIHFSSFIQHLKCLCVPALSWLLGTDTEAQPLLLELPAVTGEKDTHGWVPCTQPSL